MIYSRATELGNAYFCLLGLYPAANLHRVADLADCVDVGSSPHVDIVAAASLPDLSKRTYQDQL